VNCETLVLMYVDVRNIRKHYQQTFKTGGIVLTNCFSVC